jgi:general secretion pathway protein E
MSAVMPPKTPRDHQAKKASPAIHAGPLDWRRLVEWLSEDGVISSAEAQRTLDRCSQVQSAQHPLVRLASVSMTRVADGKPLDIETIAQWLAGRASLSYLRIDPLKVDVGKVADTIRAVCH